MDLKVFDLRCWADWLVRTVLFGGLLFWCIMLGQQVMGWEVAINLPTIEHTFKKGK